MIEAAGYRLVVLDVQERFLARVEADRQVGFLERIAALSPGTAHRFGLDRIHDGCPAG